MSPRLSLSIQFGEFQRARFHKGVLSRRRVRAWVSAALETSGRITVRVVGEDEGRELNRQYRQKDYATNVLTFDYETEPEVVADLVLCAPVVEREAAEQGKTLVEHYAHLIVHGALHAQGYDHETGDEDAAVMEGLEVLLMGSLRFRNPY